MIFCLFVQFTAFNNPSEDGSLVTLQVSIVAPCGVVTPEVRSPGARCRDTPIAAMATVESNQGQRCDFRSLASAATLFTERYCHLAALLKLMCFPFGGDPDEICCVPDSCFHSLFDAMSAVWPGLACDSRIAGRRNRFGNRIVGRLIQSQPEARLEKGNRQRILQRFDRQRKRLHDVLVGRRRQARLL